MGTSIVAQNKPNEKIQHSEKILEVRNLKKYFPIKAGVLQRTKGYIKAVDGIDFFIRKGETFGLVGESGCGKSTAGRTITRLYEPTEGEIFFLKEKILLQRKRDTCSTYGGICKWFFKTLIHR